MNPTDNLTALAERGAGLSAGSPSALHDGSRVAVIGAGPSGSMFSYFLLDMAETIGLDVAVDIFEPRSFSYCGPAGCNHCGGVVSEMLVQRLATEGISLPEHVVQRSVDSYMLHMDVGDVKIATPLLEKRIAALFRGNGPRNSEPLDVSSFDGYLLHLATTKGANVVPKLVVDVSRDDRHMQVRCADQHRDNYDLVVVATGVNSKLVSILEEHTEALQGAGRTKTFICEFRLGRDVIRETFGDSMHVFLLDIPRLVFAALIPKGDYVTLCILGDEIDEALIKRFFESPEVRNCFPDGVVPTHVCHCYPRINVRSARPAYGDRLVMIGDCGTTRLFKDGIGASYKTAKAAAKTAVFHGVSAKDFRENYWPLCQKIRNDNQYGKVIFGFSSLAQKARFARRGILYMTAREQQRDDGPRRMSGVLWDLFSGSASYAEILLRTLHPVYVGGLLWNLVAGNLPRNIRRHSESRAEEQTHVGH